MKKMREVELILKSYGFIKLGSTDEWKKGGLIIRFFEDEMEAYDEDLTDSFRRYYICPISLDTLVDIINE